MRKYYVLILSLFSIGVCQAQVGVNTKSPLGVLHIDPKQDTNTTGTSGTADDIIITNTGTVGIGVMVPTANLDIRGNIIIEDGTQAYNKVLTADANGASYWSNPDVFTIATGTITNNVAIAKGWKNITTTQVSLTAGTWLVTSRIITKNASKTTFLTWIQLITSTDVVINAAGSRPANSANYYAVAQTSGVHTVPTGTTQTIRVEAQNHSEATTILNTTVLGGCYLKAIKLY